MLYLPPGSNYKVYKPFKYGRLNVSHAPPSSSQDSHAGATEGHSLSFVLSMLEDLWTKAIEEFLEIDRKDFKVGVGHVTVT